jgi:hypothetical protein
MAFEPSKHVNGRMWPPGVSGNPNGRPVGSRTGCSNPPKQGGIEISADMPCSICRLRNRTKVRREL